MKGQVRGGVCTLHAERLSMVELKVVYFLAALATLVDRRTAGTIAFVDGSAHGRRMCRRFRVGGAPTLLFLGDVGLRRACCGCSVTAELLLLERRDQQPHRVQE